MTRTTSVSDRALANTRRTVHSYEGFAREYDKLCSEQLPLDVEDALRRMVQCIPVGGSVLEIGSGPGREADFVESIGAAVRRTDAAQTFLDLQAERGKSAELLNVVTDELDGPYDAVLALCVLIHVDREQIDTVLQKVWRALRPGGAFLVSMRKGDGETSGNYHTVYWTRDRFAARLVAAGLAVQWDMESVDIDSDEWITFLARRAK
ncbi:MAG: class I SAM-dependent methyltransferase [Hyphomonadaceae bacterium]